MNKQREITFALLLAEVLNEIKRSEDKFGDQDKNPINPPINENNLLAILPAASQVQGRNDHIMDNVPGTIDHFHIILEELAEAVEASGPNVRKELVQLACVTVKAIRALDSQTHE